jgi:hypothetical protein
MIAEKDPIALAMLAQYKIPMPNLRLNDIEVAALLSYLDEESLRLAALQPPGPDQAAAHGDHPHHQH